ncbi:unnamed protein product [Ranitomeya imitator]|uniref:Recombination activating protein 1 n=1 Tax=Ranitomeya imitator TaxID=111125 RepID=A0ABN9LWS9_9NEOB|nr:unnamed protein product [Ranitomeya imitator]
MGTQDVTTESKKTKRCRSANLVLIRATLCACRFLTDTGCLVVSAGIPRSVLKDWRKVKKLKQTGESFLQDDSCCEIGPNLQKCRECRLIRTKKGEESTHSPVFCRFYYFRRLSFSKNGVVRIDGFSTPDQYDDEALSLWTHENYEDDELDLESIKYILGYIGDKFCQMVTSEKAAMSWVKKDAKIAWKRAVRGVREMCDACEATLFNVHWVCQKCGFVVCLDCYKAKERKSSREISAKLFGFMALSIRKSSRVLTESEPLLKMDQGLIHADVPFGHVHFRKLFVEVFDDRPNFEQTVKVGVISCGTLCIIGIMQEFMDGLKTSPNHGHSEYWSVI